MSSRVELVVAVAFFLAASSQVARGEEKLSDEQVIARIASYKFGDSRAQLSAVEDLVLGVGKGAGDADRLAAKLHPLLGKDSTPDCKQFVCRQLAVLGSTESVAPLAVLLTDEKLADAALYALDRIDDPAVGEALLAALGKAPKKVAIGMMNSLGRREEFTAAEAMIQRSESDDAEIRAAAIHALGQISGERPARTLLRLLEKSTGAARISVLHAILACANKFARDGYPPAAKTLYEIAFVEGEPITIRVAAFKGLVTLEPKQALQRIVKHLADPEAELQDAALSCVRNMRDADATEAFVHQLPKLSPARQALLLRALADRGDRAITPVVMTSLDSEDQDVRVAAWYALGHVGTADAVKRLARMASAPASSEQAAARESLAVLRGDDIDAAIVTLLENPLVKTRAQLAAALGARNSVGAVNTLLKSAQDPDAAVRLASVASLGSLATQRELPELVELLLKAPAGAEQEAAETSVVATARRITNPDERSTVVLNALSQAQTSTARARLLPVVGRIGGVQAIAAVESSVKDPDEKVRESAVRTLAAWPQPEALPSLLAIVKSSDEPSHRLAALQGYIRLLGVPSTRPPRDTLAAFREAYGLTTRLDEKRQIIALLPRVRIPETLTFILPLLNDAELMEDVALATVRLSTVGRQSTISRDDARAAMRQVLAVSKNPATREAAITVLESK